MKTAIKNLTNISLSMFRKGFLGISHGSISTRLPDGGFLINKKDAIFDAMDENSYLLLYHKQDDRWNEASIDSSIHSAIYQTFANSRYIAYGMPPFIAAYSLSHSHIIPRDFFGSQFLGELPVYNPKDYKTWYERADVEIPQFLQTNNTNIMVIRGFGVYVFSRDLHTLSKILDLLENSCKILYYNSVLETTKNQDLFDI